MNVRLADKIEIPEEELSEGIDEISKTIEEEVPTP